MSNIYEVNELMTIAKGEHSDYCVQGLFKVVKQIDAKELLSVWAKSRGLETRGGAYIGAWREGISFVGWLNRNGYIEEVQYRELHIGDDHEVEISE